jgi:RHS repeat-associated protein
VHESFNAWGQRRGSNWTGAPSPADQTTINSTSHIGFTGQEQLDNLNLVHLNGRVYDPVIARFVSADPIVQAPYDSQSLNRYSYTFDNPLNATDPTGFEGEPATSASPAAQSALEEVVVTAQRSVTDAQQNSGQQNSNLWAAEELARLMQQQQMMQQQLQQAQMQQQQTQRHEREPWSQLGLGASLMFRAFNITATEWDDPGVSDQDIDATIIQSHDDIAATGADVSPGAVAAGGALVKAIVGGTIKASIGAMWRKVGGLWTTTNTRTAVQNAFRHFKDHGRDFGAKNAVDYTKQAQQFLRSPPPNTLTQVRSSNGDVVRYNAETNTFGVMDSNGVPRTFYKPDPAVHGYPTNLDYFNAQH